MTNREENVEMVLEKRNFLSKKFVNGRNKSAIKAAKNNGAKTPLPIFAKYPKAKILTSTKAKRRTNGNFISFIIQSKAKRGFQYKKNASKK